MEIEPTSITSDDSGIRNLDGDRKNSATVASHWDRIVVVRARRNLEELSYVAVCVEDSDPSNFSHTKLDLISIIHEQVQIIYIEKDLRLFRIDFTGFFADLIRIEIGFSG